MKSKTWLIVLVTLAVLTGGVAGVAAQEDPPGAPASFYGDVEDDDGDDAPEGTTIAAVVDGDVEATITIDEDGSYGGEEAEDPKLRVDSEAGDEVAFHIDDEDGAQADETHSLDDGTHELDLTFPAGTFEEEEEEDDDTSPGGGGGASPPADDDDDDVADDDPADDDPVADDDPADDDPVADDDPADDPADDVADDDGDGVPGFGAFVAVAALLSAVVLAVRR